MPDFGGGYDSNPQRAKSKAGTKLPADPAAAREASKETPKGGLNKGGKNPKATNEGAGSTTLSDNGDGTFSTSGPGGEMTHPAIGHALMHIAGTHSGGVHTTTQDDPMGGQKTYSVDETGQVQEGGPDDESMEDPSMDDDNMDTPMTKKPPMGLAGV